MQSLQDVLLAAGATGLTGWTLQEATAMTADGITVVGYGLNRGGAQAFIATLVPIPTAAFLFPSALGLLGWARRRR